MIMSGRIGRSVVTPRGRSVLVRSSRYEWLLSFQKQPFFIELATGRLGRTVVARNDRIY